MDEVAVSLVASAGQSALTDSRCDKTSAKKHAGAGIYLQLVNFDNGDYAVYVGKSDCSVQARQHHWDASFTKGGWDRAPRIARARRSFAEDRYYSLLLMTIPGPCVVAKRLTRHRGAEGKEALQDLVSYKPLELKNTLCSAMEAALIASVGTFMGKKEHDDQR
jgi:hypothetical protein